MSRILPIWVALRKIQVGKVQKVSKNAQKKQKPNEFRLFCSNLLGLDPVYRLTGAYHPLL
jgi:hypothetical protein